MPAYIRCHTFRQHHAPLGYDVQEFGPWEPVTVLVCHDIPGRHRTVDQRTVAVAYVRSTDPAPAFNRMLYRLRPEAADPHKIVRIKAICCGRSVAGQCPAGARVTSPCSHGAMVIMAGCVLAHGMEPFNTSHRKRTLLEPQRGYPTNINAAVMNQHFS